MIPDQLDSPPGRDIAGQRRRLIATRWASDRRAPNGASCILGANNQRLYFHWIRSTAYVSEHCHR